LVQPLRPAREPQLQLQEPEQWPQGQEQQGLQEQRPPLGQRRQAPLSEPRPEPQVPLVLQVRLPRVPARVPEARPAPRTHPA
jgi:hypothetical protein